MDRGIDEIVKEGGHNELAFMGRERGEAFEDAELRIQEMRGL